MTFLSDTIRGYHTQLNVYLSDSVGFSSTYNLRPPVGQEYILYSAHFIGQNDNDLHYTYIRAQHLTDFSFISTNFNKPHSHYFGSPIVLTNDYYVQFGMVIEEPSSIITNLRVHYKVIKSGIIDTTT